MKIYWHREETKYATRPSSLVLEVIGHILRMDTNWEEVADRDLVQNHRERSHVFKCGTNWQWLHLTMSGSSW